MTAPGQGTATFSGRLREELRYFLEIVALTGFVVAQPVLDVFGRSPETFVFRGADRFDIFVFALIVVAAPPLVLGAGAALTNLAGPRVRHWAQVVLLSLLFGVLALQVVKKATGLHDGALEVVAIVGGIGFGATYARITGLRLWMRYASVGPVVFLVLFLAASPVADLLRAGEASAAAAEDADDGAPVVVLMLDELPLASIMRSDGTIDAGLFPNFAELAGASTWYRNATTVALRTFYAMPAILTGRYPDGREIPVSGSYPENLFTWLDGSYDIDADETITRLCPLSICPRGADESAPASHLLDDARDVWNQVSSPGGSLTIPSESLVEEPIADEGDRHFHRQARQDGRANTPERFQEFLDGIEPGNAPSLDFLHLLLPHGPSRYYPSGVTYDWHGIPGGRGGGNGDTWTTEEALVATQRQRHLLQLQYADVLVGRFIDRLQEQGLWDEAVVLVTADHGIAFTPGQSSRAGDADAIQPSWPQLLWVPLFIRAPELDAGVVSDRNVQSIDLVPTIADLAGVELPWDVDGISATGKKERPADDKQFLNSWSDSGVEKPGTRRPVDPAAGNADLRGHAIDLFVPDGDPKWAVYRAGPHPELVGTTVDGYAVNEPAGSVELDKSERFERAAPSGGKVPGAIWGTIDSVDAAPGEVLAVAVNGTIGATTRVLEETRVDFSVIPPDFLWRDGANDVEVFLVVEQTDGSVELRPLPAT
ncbi:MAG TPA: sulfatase-like hydrolase/transferase [Acidimicrobiia bacterium]|nr:sulfatase-like hydrolase/transferase [Acidimicrobiia bacterium]